jgi:leader peptidase (prepilin peptidase) / N-methyltransferase
VGGISAALPLWFLLASLTVLGAIWGSFVAALCSRWANNESVLTGRSRCDQCSKPIAPYDLLPVISYLVLKGKCRKCGHEIGIQSVAVELISASIGAVSCLFLPASQALAAAVFGWSLLPLIILDYRHLWLPDRLVVLLVVAGLLFSPLLTPDIAIFDRAMGALAGFFSLEIIRRAYQSFRRREGMGAGDPKLFGALGIWLGWQALPFTLLIASAIGLGVLITVRVVTARHPSIFPFGSYLAVAGYLIVLAGNMSFPLR